MITVFAKATAQARPIPLEDPVIRTYFFFIVFVPFKIIDCQRTVYQEKLRGANEEKLNVVIVLYLDYGCAKIYK